MGKGVDRGEMMELVKGMSEEGGGMRLEVKGWYERMDEMGGVMWGVLGGGVEESLGVFGGFYRDLGKNMDIGKDV